VKARWLAFLFLGPMLLICVALIPVVILGVLAPSAQAQVSDGQLSRVIGFLFAQIGKPYSASQPDGPDSWDCSGLVTGAYATIGINLPSLTFDQVKLGDAVPIDRNMVQPGDAVFMRGGEPVTDLGHVGVAISTDQMISAPRTGENVHITTIPWGGVRVSTTCASLPMASEAWTT
jgi:cell wall-associated NlpC family hydrolase